MSVQLSKAAVIEKNKIAISACEAVINRLEHVVGLPAAMELQKLAQITRARNLKTQLRAVNTHLKTAGTVVSPMSEAIAAELNALGNKLDQQIQSDAIANATLDFAISVLADVNRLRGITRSHQG